VNYLQRFKVLPGSRVKLKDVDPGFKDAYKDHDAAEKEIAQLQNRLRELQVLLYAERRRSLLICLQGMDTAGKDGTISHVMGAMNPQGCRVEAFRKPTAEELAHDFLWRVHRVAPAMGEVVIFNRSHYEDVLIARVHKWFRNLAVARIVVEYLETLKMKYPKPTVDLKHIRQEYHAAKQA
jgi:polyphosphate kinase 2 (PPK2 family)